MTSSEVSSSRNVDLYIHSCCVCSRCRYCYLGWQSAWGVNVYMFIKRVAVQYRRSLELGTDPYVSFTHACRFREDPLLSWTLAENCYAVWSCRVQSSCCCACVFVAKCDTWRTGAYNFNVSTRLHESQRHQASNGLLLLYRSSHSCRLGFGPNSELGCAIGRPSFEIPRSFMHQGTQGRSLPLTEKAR